MSAAGAAFVNGTAMHSMDFDERGGDRLIICSGAGDVKLSDVPSAPPYPNCTPSFPVAPTLRLGGNLKDGTTASEGVFSTRLRGISS